MNKLGRVGSSDVAKLAGVSRSAVSRTFTEGAYVSAETRSKVLRAAELLGYRPNVLARSLTTNRTHIIGVVTTHLDNPFYAVMLQRLIENIQGRGMATLVLSADGASNDESVSRLLSYQVDGLILTNTSLSSAMAIRCARGDKPVVAINRYLEIENITSVTCDNEGAGAAVANLFADMGRRRIAFVAGEPDTSSSRDRERGFRRRLTERGALLHAIETGYYEHDAGAQAARALLSMTPPPDAIFCANDLMAFAVLDIARDEFSLRIPEDLAVVGFDNSDAANWPAYRLTSIDQNMPKMIDLAVEELLASLAGNPRTSGNLRVQGSLVERESAARNPLIG